jgi:hypothetical protein
VHAQSHQHDLADNPPHNPGCCITGAGQFPPQPHGIEFVAQPQYRQSATKDIEDALVGVVKAIAGVVPRDHFGLDGMMAVNVVRMAMVCVVAQAPG